MNTITTQHEAVPVGNLQQAAGGQYGGPHLSPAEAFDLLFRKYHPPITRAEPFRRRLRVQWHEASAVGESV